MKQTPNPESDESEYIKTKISGVGKNNMNEVKTSDKRKTSKIQNA